MSAALPPRPLEQLSPRRREVLALIGRGWSNDEIARSLNLSISTVRAHITGLLQDLGLRNRTEAATAFVTWSARPARVETVLARPAIAVLPLAAVGAGERARLLAAGLSIDLSTLLARWCWFPVISPSATHAIEPAPGQDMAEVGARLGASFLVNGALRPVERGWRLTVRVDDAASGTCLWNEQYDLGEDNFLAHQDEVCNRIVATVYPALRARVGAALASQSTPLSAWQLAHAGMARQASRSPRAALEAQTLLRSALELDPALVLAHFGLGLVHYDLALNQWGDTDLAARELADCARRCIELAPHAAEGHYLFGRLLQCRGEHALAVAPLEEAIGRNPSFAPAHALLAQTLILAGRPEEGLARIRHAQRLGPGAFVAGLAVVHFLRHEPREALVHAERAVALNPDYAFARVVATACAWELGDGTLALEHARALKILHPNFSAKALGRTFGEASDGVARLVKALDGTGRAI
jgi:TolB-like protein